MISQRSTNFRQVRYPVQYPQAPVERPTFKPFNANRYPRSIPLPANLNKPMMPRRIPLAGLLGWVGLGYLIYEGAKWFYYNYQALPMKKGSIIGYANFTKLCENATIPCGSYNGIWYSSHNSYNPNCGTCANTGLTWYNDFETAAAAGGGLRKYVYSTRRRSTFSQHIWQKWQRIPSNVPNTEYEYSPTVRAPAPTPIEIPHVYPEVAPINLPIFQPVPAPLPLPVAPGSPLAPAKRPHPEILPGLDPHPGEITNRGPRNRPARQVGTARRMTPFRARDIRIDAEMSMQHTRGRPPRGTKEEKVGGRVTKALATAFGAITEAIDLFDAIYDALPRHCRNGKTKKAQAIELYNCFGQVNITQAMANIIANTIEDQAIGRVHRAIKPRHKGRGPIRGIVHMNR